MSDITELPLLPWCDDIQSDRVATEDGHWCTKHDRHPNDCRLEMAEARASSLDAAWAEAEAALPEGWQHVGVCASDFPSPGREYDAAAGEYADAREVFAAGPTPTAALRALAAKLRER